MEIGSRGRVIVSPEMLPDRLGTFIGTFGGFAGTVGTGRGMPGMFRAGCGDCAETAKPDADVTIPGAERAAGGPTAAVLVAGLPVRPGERS